eukprot:359492-Chlamydomonas_euryale.AAC.2
MCCVVKYLAGPAQGGPAVRHAAPPCAAGNAHTHAHRMAAARHGGWVLLPRRAAPARATVRPHRAAADMRRRVVAAVVGMLAPRNAPRSRLPPRRSPPASAAGGSPLNAARAARSVDARAHARVLALRACGRRGWLRRTVFVRLRSLGHAAVCGARAVVRSPHRHVRPAGADLGPNDVLTLPTAERAPTSKH